MMLSSASRGPFLLALIAGCFVAEGARNRITIKSYKTNYRVDWYDDGRDNPYRVTFWKFGLKSVYKFDESGNLRALTAGDDRFIFDEDIGSRKLAAPQDADVEEKHSSHRRLYDCTDCEETWDTLCDVGLADACYLDDNNPDYFTEDAEDSVRRMCSAFGAACETAASEACDGQCTETEEDIPEACDPNPCENDGECSADPGGGHMCSCASGYGGMACQTDTSSLDSFYIEVEYLGTWTDARKAVFESAAERWAEVVTHVPCGGNSDYPAGRVLISATLDGIDGVGGVYGSAGRRLYWTSCSTITATGAMTFDIDDIDNLEEDDIFEGIILHEMGHVIGAGSSTFAEGCSTCSSDGNPAWMCPAALSTYYDLGGTDANILELDGGSGTSCGHLDEGIFDDELMTGYIDSTMYLSKMTAALLDDLQYVVDPTAVDPYTLPSERVASVTAEEGPSYFINDTAVPVMIHSINDDGTLVEVEDIMLVF